MRIILIGNYRPDRQQSMQRFAHMLQEGFSKDGIDSTVWDPTVLFGRTVSDTTSGAGKWVGYLDKWIVFPMVLWWRVLMTTSKKQDCHFHICDHSNAPYLKWLPRNRTVITCHDVLAIQGAKGVADVHNPASRTGKLYQAWIFKHLISAKKLAAVSNLTLKHLQELIQNSPPADSDWRVIHNAFNAHFSPVNADQAEQRLASYSLLTGKFILHVGSSLERKNRRMLLDMVAELGDRWEGQICFAGYPLEEPLLKLARDLRLSERIVSVVDPDHDTLVALYSSCLAFVFPSFSEGFGWPIIEAQACGVPVITSSVEPMPEVSGGAALLADPTQPKAFAAALLVLADDGLRQNLIQQGLANCVRFDKRNMIKAYLDLYRS